jgi:GT2 family glycosyltransferase
MTEPTVAVIILNWNGRAYLEECLNALAAQTRPADTITLVDNGSSDDSVAFVRARFPGVAIQANGGNLGFAAGNNAALRRLAADVAVLLNPDVILNPGCLAALLETLASDPTIGLAGGKLWYPGGEIIQHAGGFITRPQALPGHYGIGERDAGQCDTTRDVEYLIGAAVAIRRELFDQVGLFDEGFFLFFEDVDLCARARRAGFRVVYTPAATGIHVESATAVRGSFAYLQRFHTGRWRYLLKHFPVETILDETLPAEAAWLDQLGDSERRAAALAYLATRRRLVEIGAARARDGLDPWSEERERTIEAGLRFLWARAQRGGLSETSLARLSAAATLEERPFTSTTPIIGPLIARLRSAWNDVASRWYLRHLMTQQFEFNRLAIEQLARYETETREMYELVQMLEEQVVVTSEMSLRLQELEALVAELWRGEKSGY